MRITPLGWLYLAAAAGLFLVAYPYRDEPARWLGRGKESALAAARSWHYQLDGGSVASLAASPADVVVIDFANGGAGPQLSPQEVAHIKRRPDGSRRLVLAYMSIGEAEEFRFYWDKSWKAKEAAPDWLGEENCAWPQAHRVRFWREGWKQLIYRGPGSYLSRIIAAGFDGVYLDRADIYQTLLDERPIAEADMVDFVIDLAATARRAMPGFLVVPQNAEALLDHADYRGAIDGVAKESLLYGLGKAGERNSQSAIGASLALLSKLQRDGKPVFIVEYLTTRESIDEAGLGLRNLGFVPAFETRALDGKDPTRAIAVADGIGTPQGAPCPPNTAW